MSYQLLDWDTEFFGFRVAHLTAAKNLAADLDKMRSDGIELAYVSSVERLPEADCRRLGGSLLDRKTTYVVDLRTLALSLPREVEPFDSSMSMEELETLAVLSGEYSRFALDPGIPNEKKEQVFAPFYRLFGLATDAFQRGDE